MNILEAKQKVCPFIQHGSIVAGQAVFGSVDQYTYANINCITSECMAWKKINLNPDDGYCLRLPE